MDWITGIQKAINYIENNITEELDYEAIAKESFSSPFHFQRVFSIMMTSSFVGKLQFIALARERPRLPCAKGAVKNLLIFD